MRITARQALALKARDPKKKPKPRSVKTRQYLQPFAAWGEFVGFPWTGREFYLAESLRLDIPGALHNYANKGGYYGGRAEATYRKRWREKTRLIVRSAPTIPLWATNWVDRMPKRIEIEAVTWNAFDPHDGLRNALKPVVDGLVRAGVIHSDDKDCGHEFFYGQVIRRTGRGVRIRVTDGYRPPEWR